MIRTICVLGLLLQLTGCRSGQDTLAHDDHPLTRLFDEDQQDRTPKFTLEEFTHFSHEKQDSLTRWLDARDAGRRDVVVKLMKHHAAKSAVDYYHAAMIMQHSLDTTDNIRAHEWLGKALQLDSSYAPAKYLYAASTDRILIRRGQLQWYGTNVNRAEDGTAYLAPIDTTKVTDAERKRLTGWTLAQRRAAIDSLNVRIRKAQ